MTDGEEDVLRLFQQARQRPFAICYLLSAICYLLIAMRFALCAAGPFSMPERHRQLHGVSERKDDTKCHQYRHHASERLEQTFFDTDMMFAWQTADHRMHEGVGTKLRTGGEPSND
jgi:hypothetical protein